MRFGVMVIGLAVFVVVIAAAVFAVWPRPDGDLSDGGPVQVAGPTPSPAAGSTLTPPISGYTPAPGSTAPTPSPLGMVSRQQLPGMVLDQADIDMEFPGLQRQEQAGYFDQNAASNYTIDPTDTADEMTANGFLTGYEQVYSASDPLLRNTVSARVYLWDTPENAEKFMQRHKTASRRSVGGPLQGGVTLNDYKELNPQPVGDQTVASRLEASFAALNDAAISITVLMWRRGSMVGAVGLLALDATDRLPALERLAQRMDDRIDGVLKGEIAAGIQATASTPSPTPQPGIPEITPTQPPAQASPPTVSANIVDLTEMMLSVDDPPAGAIIEREGPVEKAGALQAYGRSFKPQSSNLVYGSSEFIEVRPAAWEYADAKSARAPVDFLNDQGITGTREMAQSQSTPATVPELESFDLPQIGDVSFALVVKTRTRTQTVDAVVVHFANGPIRAQLLVIGPSDRIVAEDIASLAERFNQRITANLPR